MFGIVVLSEQPGSITAGLSGAVSVHVLPQLQRWIASQQAHRRVLLDLSEVTLIDRVAAAFFQRILSHGVGILNPPPYIQHWISPGTDHDSEG